MDLFQEKIIYEMYNKRRPLKQIQKRTGIPSHNIEIFLKEKGLWTGHKYMLHYFDEFFFDNIDTEEKAYWLGFIYADGYLASPRTIGIELKSSEFHHLEKFKKDIEAEHSIKIYKKNSTFGPQENCRIAFSSQHMFNILINYYGTKNKTYEGHLPLLKDKKMIPHLIRGVFDGDGSLSGKPKNIEKYLFRPCLSFCGTKETLKYIENISGFKWGWNERHPERNNNNYQISIGRVKDSLNFLEYMYKDATVYLDRKYALYQELLKNRSTLSTKVRV